MRGTKTNSKLPPPGFEPESSDRKSEMIGRTTPQGLDFKGKSTPF